MQIHDTELSQAYREAKHPEPSAALDANILAAAQAAVAPQRRRPAWFGWAVPLSTTAVLVLGISLLFRMQLEAPETLRKDLPPLPALESAPSLATSASDAPADRSVAPAATAQAIAERKTDQTSAAPTVAAAAPEFAANTAAVASVASAPAAMEERAAIAPMLPPRSSPVADSVTVPAPVSAPAPAAAAGASLAREYAIRAEKESAAKAVSPSSEPASAARLKQGMSRMQAATLLMESPEQWVESIRKLLREGRVDAARTRLQELRKRFPDFPLPPDMEPSRCCPLPPASTE
jgi:hypothetical protein